MRKLASVQKVLEVFPHENAENLEIAKILGWVVCVKKGEFKAGDLCVYIEIDSILPQKSEFEFLRNKGFRIKTIKLRSRISQGIAFPISILSDYKLDSIEEGLDVTDLIGVVKYEPPIHESLRGEMEGLFPNFIPKTDEARIQSNPHFIELNNGGSLYYSEKLDGTSLTIFVNNGEFGVCSRNFKLKDTEISKYWRAVKKYNLQEKMLALGKNFAIQGELIGPGIQGNKYKLEADQFRPFKIYWIDEGHRGSLEDLKSISAALGLETVPILDENFQPFKKVEDFVDLAKGFSKLNSSTLREGLVFVAKSGEFSFKAISPEFNLKYSDD